jgi:hypothetical protein
MTLSDAIRLGSMLTPKGLGGWMDGYGRCALAAASEAAGVQPRSRYDVMTGAVRPSVDYSALAQRFPVLDQPALHPMRKDRADVDVCDVIWSLNDCWDWSREDIAAWLEAIERAQTDVLEAQRNALLDHMQQTLDYSFGQ